MFWLFCASTEGGWAGSENARNLNSSGPVAHPQRRSHTICVSFPSQFCLVMRAACPAALPSFSWHHTPLTSPARRISPPAGRHSVSVSPPSACAGSDPLAGRRRVHHLHRWAEGDATVARTCIPRAVSGVEQKMNRAVRAAFGLHSVRDAGNPKDTHPARTFASMHGYRRGQQQADGDESVQERDNPRTDVGWRENRRVRPW